MDLYSTETLEYTYIKDSTPKTPSKDHTKKSCSEPDNKTIEYIKHSDNIENSSQDNIPDINPPIYIHDDDDIMSSYIMKDTKYLPISNYMDCQTNINASMRAMLVDWLIYAHKDLSLHQRTLYITINTIDRFLSKSIISRERLQLLGMIAMFTASKYEESEPPSLHKILEYAQNHYNKPDAIRMEQIILERIEFDFGVITSYDYLGYYFGNQKDTKLQEHIAMYLTELSMMDYEQMAFTPSTTACSSIILANIISGHDVCTKVLDIFRKNESDVLPCLELMSRYLKKISSQMRNSKTKPLTAAIEKYRYSDKLGAARVCANFTAQ